MSDKVLEARLKAVEEEVEGEKLLSRHILEQTRRNGADIATLKADMGGVKADIVSIKADIVELKSDVRALGRKFDAFQSSFPGIVAETVREVMRERGR